MKKKNVTVFVFAQKPNLEKHIILRKINSFIISTCPNPVLLVPDSRQVGQCEDWRDLYFITFRSTKFKLACLDNYCKNVSFEEWIMFCDLNASVFFLSGCKKGSKLIFVLKFLALGLCTCIPTKNVWHKVCQMLF